MIVENQLEQTDHGHLGQLLTYAGGTDPTTIVWCAPSFREEHRAAIDWLNERTDERTRFFAVEISAVRIDSSRPAPLFRLVAKPNDWSKEVRAEKARTLSPRAAALKEFWTKLQERMRVDHPEWQKNGKSSTRSYLRLPHGSDSAWYAFLFTDNGLEVELFFGGSTPDGNAAGYERVVAHRAKLEEHFGEALAFQPPEGKKAPRISHRRPGSGDVLSEHEHGDYLDWFISTMERFREATQHVRVQIAAEV